MRDCSYQREGEGDTDRVKKTDMSREITKEHYSIC